MPTTLGTPLSIILKEVCNSKTPWTGKSIFSSASDYQLYPKLFQLSYKLYYAPGGVFISVVLEGDFIERGLIIQGDYF